jgi:molybdopterin converting factor small subunit
MFIPALLRGLAGGQERVAVEGRTLGEAILALEARFPGLGAALAEGDHVRPGLAVALDGEIVAGWLSLHLGQDSEVHFVPPVSGGTRGGLPGSQTSG